MTHETNGRPPDPAGADSARPGRGEKTRGGRVAKESSAWVERNINLATKYKRGLGIYGATHLVEYGYSLLIGAGTTFPPLMLAIIDRLTPSEHHPVAPLDLTIFTNNIGVFDVGRMAQQRDQGLFGNTSVVLVGGSYHASTYSLMGEYAASAVRSDRFYPDLVIFGARGLCFGDNDLIITYQFQEELSTQASFATRPTEHRLLFIDHAKLGSNSGWQSEAITARSMLEHTPLCTIISTYPDDLPEDDPRRLAVDAQFDACKRLFKRLADRPEFAHKELEFRLVNELGTVVKEQRLSAYRQPQPAEHPPRAARRGKPRKSRATHTRKETP